MLICGGRGFSDRVRAYAALDAAHAKRPITMVIHGNCRGGDLVGKAWANSRGIHDAAIDALWDFFGKPAGFKRNSAMLILRPDGVTAFPGGRGTAGMMDLAREAGIPVWEPLSPPPVPPV